MKRYSSYKDSGVEWIEEIPSHWNHSNLKYLLRRKISDGPHETPVFTDEGIPFLSVDGIQNGELVFEGCRYISEDDHNRYNKKCPVEKNDVLMGKAASIGKIARVKVDFPVSVWSPLAIIKPKKVLLDSVFLEYSLTSTFLQDQIEIYATSNTQKNISMDDIQRLQMVFPSIQEQQNIVSFLDEKTQKIDILLRQKERKIELLKEQRIALINHAVTKGLNPNVEMKDSGVEWIGDIPHNWIVKKLSYLCSQMISGPFGSSLKKEIYSKTGYKIYGQEQVIKDDFDFGDYYIPEQKFQELRRCEIFTDDILISCVGTFGKISIVPKDFERGIINPRLLKITPNQLILPQYFLKILRSNISYSQFELLSRGGTMGVINLDILSRLKFPIPPTIEQQQMVDYLDEQTKEIDDLIQLEQRKIELLKEYRQSLISEVVTGMIRVCEKDHSLMEKTA